MTKNHKHPEYSLNETEDYIRGLNYARDLAVHINECEGVSKSQDLRHLPSYQEGFTDGCMNVAVAIDRALNNIFQNEIKDKDHDK
jgi:hypothetical protein